ncbi:hypothetical protein ABPG75_005882 [Micractinium tetrahymenae]
MQARLEAAAETVVGSGAWTTARRPPEGGGGSQSEAAGPSDTGTGSTSAACAPRSGRLSLDHLGIALGTVAQGLLVATQGHNSAGSTWERHQPHLVFALLATELAVMTLCRRVYPRHRSLVLSVFMIAVFSVPSFRRIWVGTALLMECPPQQGLTGAVRDLLGIIAARGYCSLPLLRGPLSQQRAASVAAAFELLSLPVAALGPPGVPFVSRLEALTGEAQPDAVCRATLSFLAVCVGLAPALLSTLLWRPPPANCGAAAGPPPKRLQHLLQRASAAAAACDSKLQRLLHGTVWGGRPCALLLFFVASGYLWLLCKRLGGLS